MDLKQETDWLRERTERRSFLLVLMEIPPRKEAEFCGVILYEGTEHLCNDVSSFMVGRIASTGLHKKRELLKKPNKN